MSQDPATKTCSRCKVEKPLNCFSPRGNGIFHDQCRPCRAEVARLTRKPSTKPREERGSYKHGGSAGGRHTRLYSLWDNMKQRCYNQRRPAYQGYGAKGIGVCDDWRDSFVAFRTWALASGYHDHLYLGRKDDTKDFSPDNCRWVARRGTHYTHRASSTPEYSVWKAMRARCYTPTTKHFDHYGGRGITVCDRWRDSFETFLADMGPRPSPTHSIDRIDVNGNYEPSNCRWATQSQQMHNMRYNHWVTFQGRTMTVGDWGKELGIDERTLRHRLTRYDVEVAFTMKKWSRGKT